MPEQRVRPEKDPGNGHQDEGQHGSGADSKDMAPLFFLVLITDLRFTVLL